MHHLDRSRVQTPPCLQSYQHGRHTWDNLSSEDRRELRARLRLLTHDRCAYCEVSLGSIDDPRRRDHVEHFFRRHAGHAPELTFSWENLFPSCLMQESCGKHKDESKEVRARPYRPSDLIKPDEDDPERFLLFVSDGSVRIRDGLTEAEQHRARETLRVFNLGHRALRERRSTAVSLYRNTEPGIIDALAEFPQEVREAFLREEIARTAHEEFATTIKHFLEQVLP